MFPTIRFSVPERRMPGTAGGVRARYTFNGIRMTSISPTNSPLVSAVLKTNSTPAREHSGQNTSRENPPPSHRRGHLAALI